MLYVVLTETPPAERPRVVSLSPEPEPAPPVTVTRKRKRDPHTYEDSGSGVDTVTDTVATLKKARKGTAKAINPPEDLSDGRTSKVRP